MLRRRSPLCRISLSFLPVSEMLRSPLIRSQSVLSFRKMLIGTSPLVRISQSFLLARKMTRWGSPLSRIRQPFTPVRKMLRRTSPLVRISQPFLLARKMITSPLIRISWLFLPFRKLLRRSAATWDVTQEAVKCNKRKQRLLYTLLVHDLLVLSLLKECIDQYSPSQLLISLHIYLSIRSPLLLLVMGCHHRIYIQLIITLIRDW
jgi:hypothetical protein